MKWSEARENYPNKWFLFEAIESYSINIQRVVVDISVINAFDEGREALKGSGLF